jgi:hypothetical protein
VASWWLHFAQDAGSPDEPVTASQRNYLDNLPLGSNKSAWRIPAERNARLRHLDWFPGVDALALTGASAGEDCGYTALISISAVGRIRMRVGLSSGSGTIGTSRQVSVFLFRRLDRRVARRRYS